MPSKAIVVLAQGFEEIEAATPIDILRRANLDVEAVGLDALEVTGAHGLTFRADRLLADAEDADAVILPGGLPGAENLAASARLADLQERIRTAEERVVEVNGHLEVLAEAVVNKNDVAEVLSRFEPVWETLSPREQLRVIQLLVERVNWDGENATVSIAFRPTGLKALAEQAETQKGARV